MLRRATIVQLALGVILVGLAFILVGAEVRPAPPPPKPVTSWRPATDLDRREADRQLLLEEMDRLRASPYTTPPPR